METSDRQLLIDICFEIGIMTATHEWFRGKTTEEVADWIRTKLSNCGFKTIPVGMSWGVLADTLHNPLKETHNV